MSVRSETLRIPTSSPQFPAMTGSRDLSLHCRDVAPTSMRLPKHDAARMAGDGSLTCSGRVIGPSRTPLEVRHPIAFLRTVDATRLSVGAAVRGGEALACEVSPR